MRFVNRILVFGIAFVAVVIYLYTAAPFMLFEDAPRFLAAIITLGIAKPAEPVYVFLAHWFTYFPFGSVVFRIQLFSALLAGGSLLLLYRLVNIVLSKQSSSGKRNQPLLNKPPLLSAGIFSMLTLGFSYQFWSQAQNIETFILDCFIELVVLNLLLAEINHKNTFKIFAVVTFICGIATGTDLPVIASVFPSVLIVLWYWRKNLGIKKIISLLSLGFAGIAIAWSYLPIMESRSPLLNYVNGSTLQGIWDIATGQGLNVYKPSIGVVNGFTKSPTIMLSSFWQYFEILWMNFTPIVLPFVLLGVVFLWRKQRFAFFILFLVVITNLILSVIYLSGNQESWYLQSDVIFAVLAGLGYFWIISAISPILPKLNLKFVKITLFILVLMPLIYWWPKLDRHAWNLTKDYIKNLYQPAQEPALVIGEGDLWEASSSYVYVTENGHQVIPICMNCFAEYAWLRSDLVKKGVDVPNASGYQKNLEGFNSFMNDFFSRNLGKFHIYLTIGALEDRMISGTNVFSLRINDNKFRLIPVGMLHELVAKDGKNEIDLSSFNFHFGNGFPKSKPFFMENIYVDEMQGIVSEMTRSYDSAANFLVGKGSAIEAAYFYNKAYETDPKDGQILSDIGVFYANQSQFDKALFYFKKALVIQPGDATILYDIDMIKKKQNETQSSQKDLKHFKNLSMNISFNYPQTLKSSQVNPQVVSLSQSDGNQTIYIYSGRISNNNEKSLWVPFELPSKLKQSRPLSLPNFQAVLDTFDDTTGEIQLFVLKKNSQLVAVMVPASTKIDPDVVNRMIQSILLLH